MVKQDVTCPHCGNVLESVFFSGGERPVTLACGCGNFFAARVKPVYVVETHLLNAWHDMVKPEPAAPAKPQPDWSKAPEWAKWWAVDKSGEAYWYWGDEAPGCVVDIWSGHESEDAGYVSLRGFDWRNTLTDRPEGV
jgi:transcription elongation factor Elf1